MNNSTIFAILAIAFVASLTEAVISGGKGTFDREGDIIIVCIILVSFYLGRPIVVINGINYSAASSRSVNIGEGSKCVKCFIEPPTSFGSVPQYFCHS